MRTAIYVHESSRVTIRIEDPVDAKAALSRYRDPAPYPAAGTHELAPGVYLIISRGPLQIEGAGIAVETLRDDKDEWPDPKPHVIILEPGASAASLKQFFTIAKDLSVDG